MELSLSLVIIIVVIINDPLFPPSQNGAATALAGDFVAFPQSLTVGFGQVLSWDEVHDAGLSRRQLERPQRHVAVEKTSLVDEAEDLGSADDDAFLGPIRRPVVEHELSDITGRILRVE